MTTVATRQKLYDYIRVAETKKVKAIYTMLESEIEGYFDWWEDEKFVAKLEKRSAEFKRGDVKGVSWEEVIQKIKLYTRDVCLITKHT